MYSENDFKLLYSPLPFIAMNTPTQQETAEVYNFQAWQASFGQLCLTGDPHINSQKSRSGLITKTSLFKYIENYTSKKFFFQIKILIFFFIFLLKTDCGYSLEPPRRGGSNEYPQSIFLTEIRKIMYATVNPSFTI